MLNRIVGIRDMPSLTELYADPSLPQGQLKMRGWQFEALKIGWCHGTCRSGTELQSNDQWCPDEASADVRSMWWLSLGTHPDSDHESCSNHQH